MSKKTVLIIDDDYSFVLIASRVLNVLNIDSMSADCIESANDVLKEITPSLIFLDMSLSENGMNGLDFLEERSKDKALRNIPTIMLSSDGNYGTIYEALKFGADSYLIKPLKIELFKAQLMKFGLI